MNTTMIVDVPRQALRTGIDVGAAAVRLPVERLAERFGDGECWPPLLTVDAVLAGVRETVGGVLHDETLQRAGRLEAARVSRLREAIELETVAEYRRDEATQEYDEAREKAESRRAAAVEQADRRREQAAGQRRAADKHAEQTAAVRTRQAAEKQTQDEANLQKDARQARGRNAARATTAVRDAEAALAAEDAALELQEEIETSRTRRRRS